MYFINYFYVSVTDDAAKCPRAKSPASSWAWVELWNAELAAPSWPHRIGITESAAPPCPISLPPTNSDEDDTDILLVGSSSHN